MDNQMDMKIPIEISARHVHLSQEDLEKLFGIGYKLTPTKDLSQPGQFASKETVTVAGNRGETKGVRILGPVRKHTQVELTATDARQLNLKLPVRMSGDIENSGECTLSGPAGEVYLRDGVIIAARHIHASPEEAEQFGIKDGDQVKIRAEVDGPRDIVFEDVHVRVSPYFKLTCHLDTDEANAAGLGGGIMGEIIK